ncbi:hypothetical protein ACTXT7_011990 [Hymenolepis weldensis]
MNEKTCRGWFSAGGFKKDDFSLKDERRTESRMLKKLNSEQLQVGIDENPTCNTRELSKTFNSKLAKFYEEGMRKLMARWEDNADQLERLAGIPEEKMVEAHGSFHTGHCVKCQTEYPFEYLKGCILKQEVPKCSRKICDGVVKPDIVFFGEPLPDEFYTGVKTDFPKCDLLIIMGTSLSVHPFCGIVDLVKDGVPRLLINREYNPRTITVISAQALPIIIQVGLV